MRDLLLSSLSAETLSWAGFAVLGIALVGEAGVALLALISKWEIAHKELAFVLAILAAAGYAVERVGDDAIIAGLKSQVATDGETIAALKSATPGMPDRSLTLEQQHHIAEAVKSFPGTPFVVSILNDPEPIDLLPQIEGALIAAHWVEKDWPSAGGPIIVQFTRPGKPGVGLNSLRGVYVQADVSRASDLGTAAVFLANALKAEGIAATSQVGQMPDTMDKNAVQIQIGKKQ
jgi:hypothetical protein